MPWLAVGGAAVVVLAVVGFFLFRPSGEEKKETPASSSSVATGEAPAPPSGASADTKSDPDYQTCDAGSGDGVIPACDRAIQSGKFSGDALALLYFDRGVERENAKDRDGAIADYTESIKLNPNYFAALNNRGNLYRGKGQSDQAIADLDKAIALNAKEPLLYSNRGLAYDDKREHDRAIQDFDEALRLKPNYVNGYINRGDAYRKKGERERANEDYAKALSLNLSADQKQRIETAIAELASGSPATPAVGKAAGASAQATVESTAPGPKSTKADPKSDVDYQACLKTGESTIEVCDKAIASGKFSGSALAPLYVRRGAHQVAAKNITAAVSDFSEAIQLDPNRAMAFNNRGGSYRLLGDHAKALEDLNQAIKLDPKYAPAFNNRGLLYADQREYDRAIQDFSQAITLDPDHLKAYKNRGDAYRRKGEKALATSDYNKALALNPSADVKKQIDAALYAIGSAPSAAPPEAAAQTADQSPSPSSSKTSAEAQAPQPATSTADPKADPDYQACARAKGDRAACSRAIDSGGFSGVDLGTLYRYRGYGRLHGEKPDIEGALADYTEAVRLDPQNFIPLALRSEAYRSKRDFDSEIKDLDRAIELKPEADLYNQRGNALRKMGNLDRAIEDLNKAIELDPDYFGTYWNRGLAYGAKGDRDRAAEDYKKALTLKPGEEAKKQIEALLKGLESSSASTPAGAPSQATPGVPANEKTADDGKAASDQDYKSCTKREGNDVGAACGRAIASGKFGGSDLAELYIVRGFLPPSQMPNKKKGVKDAFADFDQAIKLDSNKTSAFVGRGRTYIAMLDYVRGLEDIDQALKLNPKSASALHWRGVAYAGQGNHDRAIESFDEAIRIDAKLLMSYFFRARSYAAKGDRERAIADYKMALSLNPDSQIKRAIERSLKTLGSG